MGVERTNRCDVCGIIEEEEHFGDGWAGWGALHGIVLNGVENPSICPRCLTKVAEFIDSEAAK